MVEVYVRDRVPAKSSVTYPCICRHVDDANIVILFTDYQQGIILKYQDSKLPEYQLGKSYRTSNMFHFIKIPNHEFIELRNI